MNLQLPTCKITAVFGPVASGKTFLIRKWIENLNRVVVLDKTGEFIEDSSLTKVFASPAQLARLLKATPYFFRISYEPGMNLELDFEWVLKCLWVTPSEKTLVCDEFHELCPVNGNNADVNMMIRYARHDKLAFIGVSQRIADVHKLFTSCARMVVIFNTREARDIQAITDRWGKSTAEMVQSLRPLLHDDVKNVTQQIPQCVVIELGKEPRIFDFQRDSFITVGELQYKDRDENA